MNDDYTAFGAPGVPPRWTSSAKDGVGTAYHTAAKTWFTLSHGIVNELYYPTIDTPNTRDIGLLFTDGETFCHEEKRDFEHKLHYPDTNTLAYRTRALSPCGRYEVVKDFITDPHQPVFLMRVLVTIHDEALLGKLRIFLLIAPHVEGKGAGNSARWSDRGGQPLLHAWRGGTHLLAGGWPAFKQRSVGYVGASDGWQDLMDNYQMNYHFQEALDGNVAMVAEMAIDRSTNSSVVGIGFGGKEISAATALFQALSESFESKMSDFSDQWQRASASHKSLDKRLAEFSGDEGGQYRLSRAILLAHEDKTYQGALIASLSIPWGEIQDDANAGGYHLVWPRDLYHSAMGLLAAGQTGTPVRALAYLAAIQSSDGFMPQNCWLDGEAYWPGRQLDEVAAPLLLAYHLEKDGLLGNFDPCPVLERGAVQILLNGPVTGQDRWEENSGYSPSTLAAAIGALCAAAESVCKKARPGLAELLYQYSDWMVRHLEDWCVSKSGPLGKGEPYFVRINPIAYGQTNWFGATDEARIYVANGGGEHAASEVVGGDFLALVRYGVLDPNDPLVVKSLEVIDRTIKWNLPQGEGWQRYNHDGYGQKRDGQPFDGTGTGGCWPLLAGERANYEISLGQDVSDRIKTYEAMANDGGMFPEQVWQFDDLPERDLQKGGPTGSAMPLCWAHAEYLNLLRSAADGAPFDRVQPCFNRYGGQKTPLQEMAVKLNGPDFWTPQHPTPQIDSGRDLALVFAEKTTLQIHSHGQLTTKEVAPGLHLARLAASELSKRVTFSYHTSAGEEKAAEIEIVTKDSPAVAA